MLSHLYRHYRHLCPKFLLQSGPVHRQVALRHAGTLFRKCGVLHLYDCAGNDQAQEHARNNGGIRYAPLCEICPFQRGHPVLAALIMPFAILSNTLLFIAGPFGLLALLFFNLSFVALGSSYTPTEELLDKEEEQEEAIKANAKRKKAKSEEKTEESNDNEMDDIDNTPQLPEERRKFIQESLDRWCANMGYKDSAANMLTLSNTLHISKNELSIYFDQCLKSTFRIWLSEIRFNAAKQMMTECPDYSNDIVSAECGFSSRTHLYRVFKAKEGCTPTVWREIHS